MYHYSLILRESDYDLRVTTILKVSAMDQAVKVYQCKLLSSLMQLMYNPRCIVHVSIILPVNRVFLYNTCKLCILFQIIFD